MRMRQGATNSRAIHYKPRSDQCDSCDVRDKTENEEDFADCRESVEAMWCRGKQNANSGCRQRYGEPCPGEAARWLARCTTGTTRQIVYCTMRSRNVTLSLSFACFSRSRSVSAGAVSLSGFSMAGSGELTPDFTVR